MVACAAPRARDHSSAARTSAVPIPRRLPTKTKKNAHAGQIAIARRRNFTGGD
jgi:hypothetical protein